MTVPSNRLLIMYILSYAFTFCAFGMKVRNNTEQPSLRRLGHLSLEPYGKKALFRVAFFSTVTVAAHQTAHLLLWSNHNFR